MTQSSVVLHLWRRGNTLLPNLQLLIEQGICFKHEGVTITEGSQLSCTACSYRFTQALLGEDLAAGLRESSFPRPHCNAAISLHKRLQTYDEIALK